MDKISYTYVIDVDKLNELRVEQNIKIKELSKKANLPASTVGKICAGLSSRPRDKTIEAIAKALGVSVDEIATKRRVQTKKEAYDDLNYDYLKIDNTRIERGLSVEDLSKEANVSKPTVVRICTGVAKYPNKKTLEAIADVLQLPLSEIYTKPSSEPMPPRNTRKNNNVVNIDKINSLMQKQGFTQKELANRIGMRQSSLSNILKGKIANPHLSTIANIADVLGIPYKELYIDEKDIAIDKIKELDTSTIKKIADTMVTPDNNCEQRSQMFDIINLLSDEQVVECVKLLTECYNTNPHTIKLITNIAKTINRVETDN